MKKAMEKMKSLFTALLALSLVLCMAMPVCAAEESYTLKIQSKTAGHTYRAYQVFAGDLAKVPGTEQNNLSNITWGAGVTGTELLAQLKAATAFGSTKPFANAQTAQDVADILTENKDTAGFVDAFADVVSANITGDGKASGDPTGTVPSLVYEIKELSAGYYFVKEDTLSDSTNNAYTKFILQLVADTTVDAKADVPTIDKKIVENSSEMKANTASVGDTVTFRIKSAVPNMDGYEKYYFIVNDVLSKGLTYEKVTSVKVGTRTLTENDYTVTPGEYDEEKGTALEIVLKNFIQYKENKGEEIVIEYTAIVNQKAMVGNVGNPNEVKLIYSNNPNVTPSGENKPGPGEDNVTGETPKAYTITYVSGVQINKVDANGNILTGAGFTLKGAGVKQVVVVTGTFVEDENGTYYKLKNETYTITAPTDDTKDQYESTTQKYSKTDVAIWKGENQTDTTVSGMVGADGVVRFSGLGTGEYTIEESTVPAGYNKIANVNVELTFTPPVDVTNGAETGTWSAKYSIDGTEKNAVVSNDGIVQLTVENKAGSLLPSTGGMGTTMFTLGGLGLMGVAVVMLAVRRKKDVQG